MNDWRLSTKNFHSENWARKSYQIINFFLLSSHQINSNSFKRLSFPLRFSFNLKKNVNISTEKSHQQTYESFWISLVDCSVVGGSNNNAKWELQIDKKKSKRTPSSIIIFKFDLYLFPILLTMLAFEWDMFRNLISISIFFIIVMMGEDKLRFWLHGVSTKNFTKKDLFIAKLMSI